MDDKGQNGIDQLTRRRFLALTAAAAASQATGLGLGSADDATAAADSSGKDGRGKEVIVLAGGLAGLCAAFELRDKGYRVLAVLEAQNRTGGRVRTIRSGFANGQYAEFGAVRIPDSHPFTLGYMEQFGSRRRSSPPATVFTTSRGSRRSCTLTATRGPPTCCPDSPGGRRDARGGFHLPRVSAPHRIGEPMESLPRLTSLCHVPDDRLGRRRVRRPVWH